MTRQKRHGYPSIEMPTTVPRRFYVVFGVISLEPFYQHKWGGGWGGMGGMGGMGVTASTAPPPRLRPRFFPGAVNTAHIKAYK